jgi:outer membrane protein assembly factor BamB
MAAANGVLAYVGRKERSLSQEVLVLDAKDGKTVLWRTDGPGMGPNKLYATSSALYIGSSGDGKVADYDWQTGEELWSKSFLFQRTVTHLQVVNNLVYVEIVSNSKFLLQPDTGKEIWSWVSAPNFNNEYFFLDSKTLTKDIEFSNNSGMIYATDRQTGDILWKTSVPIAYSNLAATDAAVYLVTGVPTEVKLLGVEPRSGKIINTVTFEPTTQANYVGSNQVSVDEDLGILYVFLGASRQLFAFKIVNHFGHQP